MSSSSPPSRGSGYFDLIVPRRHTRSKSPITHYLPNVPIRKTAETRKNSVRHRNQQRRRTAVSNRNLPRHSKQRFAFSARKAESTTLQGSTPVTPSDSCRRPFARLCRKILSPPWSHPLTLSRPLRRRPCPYASSRMRARSSFLAGCCIP